MLSRSVGSARADGIRIGAGPYAGYNFGLAGAPLPPVIGYEVDVSPVSNLYLDVVNPGLIPLTGTQVSVGTIYGLINLGTCRGLTFDTAGSDLENAITFTVSGLDFYNFKVTEQITIPSGVSAIPINTKKTFRYLKSISASASSGDFEIVIKPSFLFGFPYFIENSVDVMVSWANRLYYAIDVSGTGIQPLIPAVSALNPTSQTESTLVVGDTSTPSATSGDPRGAYHINPADLVNNPSGSLLLTLYIPGFDPQAGNILAPNAQKPSKSYCYGKPQYSVGWQ